MTILSQAAWVIVDDGTPEGVPSGGFWHTEGVPKETERRYSSLVKVGIREQIPEAGVCSAVLEQIISCVPLLLFRNLHFYSKTKAGRDH